MTQPVVSVILPVYNGEKYLAEALNSVLAQDYRPLDVIVIDDGSTDGSASIAKSYGSAIRYEYQSNKGLSFTRNRGVELAKGEYLSFIDADDLWTENKVSSQLSAFHSNPDVDMVFGTVQQFYSPEIKEQVQAQFRYIHETMPGYLAGTLLIGKETFHKIGPFSTNLKVGEFIDWYAKVKEQGLKELMLTNVLLKRRIHTNNMGIRDRIHQKDYLRLLKASLNRRRKASA